MANLSAAFCEEYLKTFKVRLVDSTDLQRQAQHLRYQVYCVEHGFEPPNELGLEYDHYDTRAPHALLYHAAAAEPVGTVRVVLPDEGGHTALPIHDVCAPSLLAAADLPPESTGEISRFAISKGRLQPLLGQMGRLHQANHDRHIVGFACLGLITAVRQIAIANDLTHLAALMRPALLRRLRGLGLTFEQLGRPVEHRGLRIPCFMRIDRLEESLQRHRPDLWSVYSASVH